jgi:hypothetical protein
MDSTEFDKLLVQVDSLSKFFIELQKLISVWESSTGYSSQDCAYDVRLLCRRHISRDL